MEIKLRNLGPLEQAEFELADLTVICGPNNTGKTYATYALYGFLEFWTRVYVPTIEPSVFKALYSNGKTRIPLRHYIDRAKRDLERAGKQYSKELSAVFAAQEKYFSESSFSVRLTEPPSAKTPLRRITVRSRDKDVFYIEQDGAEWLEVVLLVDKGAPDLIPPEYVLEQRIGSALKAILYSHLIPRPFISSAERTGAAIFRKELDLARNRALEVVSDKTAKFDPIRFIQEYARDYALPVERNVEFTRQLSDLQMRDSFLAKDAPGLLEQFSDIIGGEYRIVKDELYYVPAGRKNIKLTMDESSSSVRSLLDVAFYLRHVARPGDVLMIDEPELNLHPENQRRIARLLSALVNHGMKVFMTTHSDYIVKELNTLIMLNSRKDRLQGLMTAEGYKEEELLDPERVKVYVSGKQIREVDGGKRRRNIFTLYPADIDPELGIEAKSFDDTIDTMNRIQDEILYGVEEPV